MALLTAVSVTTAATTITALSAGTSNQIAASDIGNNGALINIINGSGASINVTLEDPGFSPVGNQGLEVPQAVAAGADRWFRVSSAFVDSSGTATVTLSSATTVTYKLLRA
jgi:hypothetical protein